MYARIIERFKHILIKYYRKNAQTRQRHEETTTKNPISFRWHRGAIEEETTNDSRMNDGITRTIRFRKNRPAGIAVNKFTGPRGNWLIGAIIDGANGTPTPTKRDCLHVVGSSILKGITHENEYDFV